MTPLHALTWSADPSPLSLVYAAVLIGTAPGLRVRVVLLNDGRLSHICLSGPAAAGPDVLDLRGNLDARVGYTLERLGASPNRVLDDRQRFESELLHVLRQPADALFGRPLAQGSP